MNETAVSVLCITYNQENYIGQTLDGILEQETDFDFEIIVGEDCGTDSTRQIVQSYVDRYPDRIKLITGECNVGVSKNIARIFNLSVGKYIAQCEGDDFWIDKHKLQKQVDFMEANSDYSFTFHGCKYLNVRENRVDKIYRSYCQSQDSPTEDIIINGGEFCPSASIMYRRELWLDIPAFFDEAVVGDYPQQMLLASRGKAYYMDEIMSVYRWQHPSSWSSKNSNSEDNRIKLYKSLMGTLNDFNDCTDKKYSDAVNKRLDELKFLIAQYSFDYSTIRQPIYKDYYSNLTLKEKGKVFLHNYCKAMYIMTKKVMAKRN